METASHADADNNTCIGYQSGVAITEGNQNTLVGASGGDAITTGDGNTLMGYGTIAGNVDAQNRTAIGHTATGQADNSVTLGNASVDAVYMAQDSGATVYCGKIGIGTTSPDAMLEIENSTINTDHYTSSNNMMGFRTKFYYTGASGKQSDNGDSFTGVYSSVDFADGEGGGAFANLTGVYAEAVARDCNDTSQNVVGIYGYALATTTQFDIDELYGMRTYAQAESGGAIDSNVYGIRADIDMDNAVVAGQLFGAYVNVDAESASTLNGSAFGIQLYMDVDDDPSGVVEGINVDLDTNTDWLMRHYDRANSTYRVKMSAAGQIDAEGTINASQSLDYAEYFESKDGKVIADGTTVKLDGDKIVACSDGDVPLGVIRPKSAQCVVGGGHIMHWSEKYMKDDYGGDVWEDYSITKWSVEISREDYISGIEDDTGGSVGGSIKDVRKSIDEPANAIGDEKYIREYKFHSDRIPSGVSAPDDAQVIEVGNKRQKLNPSYDNSKEYKSREERDEWHVVGLLGQIPITKGQPVASNWIKMKDVSDTVEMYFVK